MIPTCGWEDNVKIDLEVVGAQTGFVLLSTGSKGQAVSNIIMYLLVL